MAPSMRTLQRVDQAVGLLACILLQPLRFFRLGRSEPVGASRRILLVKMWGAGSIQLLTYAARVLRERHPGAELTLLTLSSNAEFARGFRVFDRVAILEVRAAGWWTLAVRIARLAWQLRAARYDEVYDFEFFTRFSALLSACSGAPRTHGFASPSVWRGGFHDRTVPFNRYRHVARNFAALAGADDERELRHEDLAPFAVERADVARVERALRVPDPPRSRRLAVLNPNAGSLSLERRWPAERFAELAARLASSADMVCALVGSADEREYTAAVAEAARVRAGSVAASILDLSGSLSPGELCAWLATASLVVSNDSGPMHLAAALGAPTLGLFGPETPLMYRPIGPRARAIWRPPICSPCINVHDNKRSTCIHGRPECLMNITVDEVERAAVALADNPVVESARPRRESAPRIHARRGRRR